MEVYRQDVKVVRRRGGPQIGGGIRGSITRLTPGALRRMVHASRNVREPLGVLLTLTYPAQFPDDGREVKRHWRAFRMWLTRRGVGGFWFLEFQQRGAPHIHVFLTGRVDRQDVARAWYRIVGSGDERHLRAGTRIETLRESHAAGAYAAKYAAKARQKEPPPWFRHVGRFWGLFGGVSAAPVEVVDGWTEAEVDEATGEVQPSQVAGLVRIVRAVARRPRVRLASGQVVEGRLRRWRDNGAWSWGARDAAERVLRCFARLGVVGVPAPAG